MELHGCKKWALIASKMPNKGSKQCRRRWQNYLNNADAKQGGWSGEEARPRAKPPPGPACVAARQRRPRAPRSAHALRRAAHGAAPHAVPPHGGRRRARTPAASRLTRAPRYAAPQDALLLEGHAKFGNRWTEIAKMVTGRTDNGARSRPRLRRGTAWPHPRSDAAASGDVQP